MPPTKPAVPRRLPSGLLAAVPDFLDQLPADHPVQSGSRRYQGGVDLLVTHLGLTVGRKLGEGRLEPLLVILANKDFPFIKTSCVESYLTDGFPMGFKVTFS